MIESILKTKTMTLTTTDTVTKTVTEILPWPEPTMSSTVTPIPTVIPDIKPIFQEIHTTGKRTLWVVTILMAISSLVFYLLSSRVHLQKRLIHTLVAISTTVSFIVYLALATGQGIDWKHDILKHTNKHVPDTHNDVIRQVLWLRYVNWLVTDPLVLVNLTILSGLPGAHLVAAVAANYVMLGAGLLGTFAGHTSRRWVWFTISAIGYLTIVYHIGVKGSRASNNREPQTRRYFNIIAFVALLTKVLYPIALAAGALSLKISIDAESVMFAVYDIVIQGIVGYWLVIANDSTSGSNLYIDGFWSNGHGNEGAIRIEEEDGA